MPKLLGIYEQELHDEVARIARAEYEVILNIGCAEGYYAAGFKRLAPATEVFAFDTNPAAQEACRKVAALNGVSIDIGGHFDPAQFAAFKDRRVLVWCDIEGAEVDLLDPAKCPALSGFDIVAELHLTPSGHTRDIILQRFSPTHGIEIRESAGRALTYPAALRKASHLDQLLAQWEWRSAPTPWAIMRAKGR